MDLPSDNRPLWERIKELEEAEEAPHVWPTVPANPTTIRADLEAHGCAYVIDTPVGFYLVHPTRLTVYGEPKLRR